MKNNVSVIALNLLVVILLFVSFGAHGQNKQDKIDTIVSTFNIAEMPQMQYKHRFEPLKFHAVGNDSLKLIELEEQLNKDSILQVVYSAFDEHMSDQEIDAVYNFVQSSAYEKMFVQSLVYKTLEQHYSYIGKEMDRITNNLDESVKSPNPVFEPISTDRADGFYITKEGAADTGTKEIILEEKPMLTSKDISKVEKSTYNGRNSEISIQFTKDAAQKFYSITKNNIGKPIAIVIEKKIVTMPYINDAIMGGRIAITGNFTDEEIDRMIALLKVKE